MVLFGDVILPHVLKIQTAKSRLTIEREIPYAAVAYRADDRDLGQRITVTGEIRETTIDDVLDEIEALRAVNDGAARSLDLEDGTAVFNALLADPEYTLDSEGWFETVRYSADGDFCVAYSVSLLEVE